MTHSVMTMISAADREKVYRRNFVSFLIDSILFTLAMSIIGANTVIPDFVRQLTDSEILIGLSGNLFTIGFTLPQLLIARYVVRYERKKWWFVGPNIPVRFVILLFAGLTAWLGRDKPSLILAAFFIAYSIAAFGDGVVGVPWADLAGTSLNARWRARMFGITTMATALIMLLISPLIGVILGAEGPGFPNNYAILFGISGVIFVISIVPGLFFHELPGGKAVAKVPALREFLPDLGRVLRDDKPFRAFILIRMLTNLFMMAAPFYVGYATVQLGLSSDVAVPWLLSMYTVGSMVGAFAYTWLGERNNVLFIRLALAASVLMPLCALSAASPGQGLGPLPLYVGFLMSGLAASSNLFAAYMNWVVDYADADQRPIYVGLSNTVSALVSLITPVIGGLLAARFGYRSLFVVALFMALAALFVALRALRYKQPENTLADAIPTTPA
ncbi:MAG: MFS transporter [Caldilineaceae bacterium]|nr:MFS transporter [Caldilineaceae bacterium]